VLPEAELRSSTSVPPIASTSRRDSARPSPGALDVGALGAEARERHEQLVQPVGVDAGAGVLDQHAHPAIVGRVARRAGARREQHLATGPVVLDRVGQEVEQHLHQPLTVGAHVAVGARIVRLVQADAAPRRQRAHERRRLLQRVGQPHRLDGELLPPGLDAGDVEHLVDQRQQVLAGRQDVLHRLVPARLELGALQQLGEAQDAVQRRAQLVAHAAQELALGDVRALGLLAGRVRLGVGLPQRLDRLPARGDVAAVEHQPVAGAGRREGAPERLQPAPLPVLVAVAVLGVPRRPRAVDHHVERRPHLQVVVGVQQLERVAPHQLVGRYPSARCSAGLW
jgi:hypothetical protein